MAYQSGSVQNTYELYDTFTGWLTGSGITAGPGWSLQDITTLNTAGTGSDDARDKVFWSSGSNGNESLTYRATFLNPRNMSVGVNSPGITASIGTKDTNAIHNVLDYIIFQGYINWAYNSDPTSTPSAPSAGTSSFGVAGPVSYHMNASARYANSNYHIQLANYSSSSPQYHEIPINLGDDWGTVADGTWTQNNPVYNVTKCGEDDSPTQNYQAAGMYNGRSKIYYVQNAYKYDAQSEDYDKWSGAGDRLGMGYYDMPSGDNAYIYISSAESGPAGSGNYTYSYGEGYVCGVLVYDKITQTEWMYYIGYNETYAWRRKKISSGGDPSSPDAPEALTTSATMTSYKSNDGWTFLWDGDDYIYAWCTSRNNFTRYSISGDSWTSLTNLPENADFTYRNYRESAAYIPASASLITMTGSDGDPSDTILMKIDDDQYIRRYHVNTDDWTYITEPFTDQDDFDTRWYDGNSTIYSRDNDTNTLYSLNISSAFAEPAASWTTVSQDMTAPDGFFANNGMWQENPITSPISKIRGQQQDHYLSSSQKMNYWFQGDQDSINIVTETSGNFFWSHFGTYDSLVESSQMKSTAGFSAGAKVNIPVESTTGFVTGQNVLIADISGSATIEKNQILRIVDSTNFEVTNLVNTFSSGTVIGTDPHKAVVTGDAMMAVASLDANGYESDGMSALYRVSPMVDKQIMRFSNTNAVNGTYTPWPLMVWNKSPTLSTCQAKGVLKNCWVMWFGGGTYPALVSGDQLNIAGTTYKVFPIYEQNDVQNSYRNKLLLLIKTE